MVAPLKFRTTQVSKHSGFKQVKLTVIAVGFTCFSITVFAFMLCQYCPRGFLARADLLVAEIDQSGGDSHRVDLPRDPDQGEAIHANIGFFAWNFDGF